MNVLSGLNKLEGAGTGPTCEFKGIGLFHYLWISCCARI